MDLNVNICTIGDHEHCDRLCTLTIHISIIILTHSIVLLLLTTMRIILIHFYDLISIMILPP